MLFRGLPTQEPTSTARDEVQENVGRGFRTKGAELTWEVETRREAIPGSSRSMRSYWAIQRSWFARVNVLCNLSRKKSREVAAHFRADF